jgi:hypothetical protein
MNRKKLTLIAVALLVLAAIACGPTPTVEPTRAPTEPPPTSPPEPTATPRPSPMPEPSPVPTTAPPPADVLFEDDFSDPNSGWDVVQFTDGEVGYRDGYYFGRTTGVAGMVWGMAGQNLADVVIEVETTQFSAPANDNNAYGVMCRVQPDNDSYLLRISGDGFYAIHRVVDGRFEELVGWTTSPLINQGNASNQLRVVCDGSTLAMFVNGQFLAETTDTMYTSGDIGLAVTTFEEEETEVWFDSLVVMAGEGGGQPPPPPPPLAGVLLEDDFSDPGSGWEIGEYDDGRVGYQDGYYFVTATRDGGAMWGVAYQNFTDVDIEVDATQVEGPGNDNNAYGVKCRVQPGGTGGDGYALMISGDGFYSIQVVTEGDYEPLVGWTTSPLINQGDATNHIRAVCVGNRLALYVNGQLLAEATDSTYTSGDISLMAATLEPETTEIHFDDIVVTGGGAAPPPAPPPSPGGVLFEDDFGDPSSGWEVGDYDEGSEGYGDGYYFIRGEADGIVVWAVPSQDFTDFTVDVDTTQVTGPGNDNNGYGIICRVQPGPEGDGYAFFISGDGFYTIQEITGGDYDALVSWSTSSVINQGNASNHIRAVCDGPNLALYVNGQLLAEATDTTYTSGDVALAAGTLEPQATEIHFDNVVIAAP